MFILASEECGIQVGKKGRSQSFENVVEVKKLRFDERTLLWVKGRKENFGLGRDNF